MTAPRTLACADVDDLAAGYVLGALTSAEEAAVRQHLASCQEPHPELEQLGGVVPYLAAAAEPIEPAPALRGSILSAVSNDAGLAARPSAPTAPALQRLRQPGRPWLRLGLAAAAVVMIALVGSTGYLALRLSESESYAAAVVRAATLAAETNSLAIKLSPATGSGLGSDVTGIAVVSANQRGIVTIEGLLPTSGSQVYEAWIITAGAQPTPAGSFQVGGDGRGWLETIPAVTPTGSLTVAVTREPGPGSVVPTLPILLSGATGT